jgi:hypothetical protein
MTNGFRKDSLSDKAAMADYMKILLYQTDRLWWNNWMMTSRF